MIHCIGDSHVSIFTGKDKISEGNPCSFDSLPHFRTYRLGPHTAHGVGTLGHHGYNSLFELLKRIPIIDPILLSYGEIDCRVHVIAQAEKQNKSIKDVVKDIVHRYAETIREVQHLRNNKIIIWCPVPTLNHYDPNAYIQEINPYPHIGKSEERNMATLAFEEELIKQFKHESVIILSIFKYVVNNDFFTNDKYYMDGVHLSQKAMPLIMTELGKQIAEKWESFSL